MSDRDAFDAFDAIPKVELHCHVQGTVRARFEAEITALQTAS